MNSLALFSTIAATFCALNIQTSTAQEPNTLYGSSYTATLYGRGYDSTGHYSADLRDLNLDVSVQDSFAQSYSRDSYVVEYRYPADEPENRTVINRQKFVASLYVRETYGDLGLDLVNTSSQDVGSGVPSGSMQSDAEIMRFDRASLFYRGEGVAPDIAGRDIRYNYKLGVGIENSGASANAEVNVFTFESPFIIDSKTPLYNLFSDDTRAIDPFVSVGKKLDSNLMSDWSIALGVGVNLDRTGGRSAVHGNHTLKFESVTFEDGTTPESLGFEIVFASGITSPNIVDPTDSSSVFIPEGAKSASRALGGSWTTGGADVEFYYVDTGGIFTVEYLTTGESDIGNVLPSDALPINFGFPGNSVQLWNIDFTGTFTGEVTLTLGYDETLLTVPEEDLFLYHYTGSEWEKLIPTIDTLADKMTVTVSSLSPFVLGFSIPEPSTLVLAALGILGLAFVTPRTKDGSG